MVLFVALQTSICAAIKILSGDANEHVDLCPRKDDDDERPTPAMEMFPGCPFHG